MIDRPNTTLTFLRSLSKLNPRMAPECEFKILSAFLDGQSQTRISPSAAPLAICFKFCVFFARDKSRPNVPQTRHKMVFANTLSSFVAFNARLYSVARCIGRNRGSKLRWTLIASDFVSRVYSSSMRLMTFTFIFLLNLSFYSLCYSFFLLLILI